MSVRHNVRVHTVTSGLKKKLPQESSPLNYEDQETLDLYHKAMRNQVLWLEMRQFTLAVKAEAYIQLARSQRSDQLYQEIRWSSILHNVLKKLAEIQEALTSLPIDSELPLHIPFHQNVMEAATWKPSIREQNRYTRVCAAPCTRVIQQKDCHCMATTFEQGH